MDKSTDVAVKLALLNLINFYMNEKENPSSEKQIQSGSIWD